MKKISNTEAELKKRVAYKGKACTLWKIELRVTIGSSRYSKAPNLYLHRSSFSLPHTYRANSEPHILSGY